MSRIGTSLHGPLKIGILENEVPLPVKIDNTDTIMRGKVTEAWEVEDVGGLLQWREGSGDLWPRCACICMWKGHGTSLNSFAKRELKDDDPGTLILKK